METENIIKKSYYFKRMMKDLLRIREYLKSLGADENQTRYKRIDISNLGIDFITLQEQAILKHLKKDFIRLFNLNAETNRCSFGINLWENKFLIICLVEIKDLE